MEVGLEGWLDMLMLCACCLFICILKHTFSRKMFYANINSAHLKCFLVFQLIASVTIPKSSLICHIIYNQQSTFSTVNPEIMSL